MIRWGETEADYVGVTWTGGQTPHADVLLRLSKGEYREFLTALERLTGIRAVDANQVPTAVRYW
jgi:hypothetical protein